jgi:hypothetical protein
MSCGDTTTMSSSMNGTSNGTAATTAGVSLGSAIERLLYFNGRFLKAEDLKLEQTGYLTRIALSERAQGAGVSYGFHVTTATSAAPDNFVKSVADAVFAKMQANPKEWIAFLDAEQGKPSPDQPPPVNAPPDMPPPGTLLTPVSEKAALNVGPVAGVGPTMSEPTRSQSGSNI